MRDGAVIGECDRNDKEALKQKKKTTVTEFDTQPLGETSSFMMLNFKIWMETG